MIFFACNGTLLALSENGVQTTGTHAELVHLYEQLAQAHQKAGDLNQQYTSCKATLQMPGLTEEQKAQAEQLLKETHEKAQIHAAVEQSLQDEIDRRLKVNAEAVLKNGGDTRQIDDASAIIDLNGGYELHREVQNA